MINEILTAIKGFFSSLRPWILVAPWEQCLRVRLGKWVALLQAGPHFRIPFIDRIYIQSIRLRVALLDRQTLTTRDGKTITLAGQLGYSIVDTALLYATLHHAEDTIRNITKSFIANYVFGHALIDCSPLHIEEDVLTKLSFDKYGLSVVSMNITEFAVTKTYRIIGDYGGMSCGSALTTEVQSANTPQ